MTPDRFDSFRAEVSAFFDEFESSKLDGERLRARLKQAEWRINEDGDPSGPCQFCKQGKTVGHGNDCPVFTSDGQVK